jgi:AhpD family alkylhydroperoxidase
MDLAATAPAQYRAMAAFARSVELDRGLRELVNVRASQVNGCAFCIDMHWKDARAAGESEERLYSLDAWRHSALYDERERAALDLCEAMTLLAETHVPDEVWDRASAVFPPQELAQLVFAITVINSWNRLADTSRMEPGHHRPAPRSTEPG